MREPHSFEYTLAMGEWVFQPSGAGNIRGQLQHALAIYVFKVNHRLKL